MSLFNLKNKITNYEKERYIQAYKKHFEYA